MVAQVIDRPHRSRVEETSYGDWMRGKGTQEESKSEVCRYVCACVYCVYVIACLLACMYIL